MTQTDQGTQTKCVYSRISTKEYDEKSIDSVETLSNPDTTLQMSMYEHVPIPTFDDWNK